MADLGRFIEIAILGGFVQFLRQAADGFLEIFVGDHWLTIGNVHRLANDRHSAVDAYTRAKSLAPPGSTAYNEAASAIASLQ